MKNKIDNSKQMNYLPKKCLIHHGICPEELELKPKTFFVGFPFKPQYEKDLKEKIDLVAERLNLKPLYPAKTQKKGVILCKVCKEIQETDFSIFDITERNPNVMLEVGLAFGFGKEVILLNNPTHAEELKKGYPIDLSGILIVQYNATSDISDESDLEEKIKDVMKNSHTEGGTDKITEIREALDRYSQFEKDIKLKMIDERIEEIELSFIPEDWDWKISDYKLPLKFNAVYGLGGRWDPLILEKENGGIYEGKRGAYGPSKKQFIGLIKDSKSIDALIQNITISFE
jgi:nucleoside 2-deoxyribosyltransferase